MTETKEIKIKRICENCHNNGNEEVELKEFERCPACGSEAYHLSMVIENENTK